MSHARSFRSVLVKSCSIEESPCEERLSPGRLAFTLIEMLIVMAIVGILVVMVIPATQGLVGTRGVTGGVSTVLSTLDNARSAAVEKGTSVYVGFPGKSFASATTDGALPYSSLIVFQNTSPGGAISRWVRLPTGVGLQLNLTPTSFSGANLPKLAGQTVNDIQAISFDRFGRLSTGGTIVVGEAIMVPGQFAWKGGANNRVTLRAQPLTGRWVVQP